ncbi:Phytochelatin synthase, C-terminal [Cynara cardunculus var. scolymus]|uniref:Phytochelatin synthase, C-terminal n=1 Tax=Cynara cardunculus var. scolymus TaxID=59895 RepID=A0A103Y7F3_CYNCS|nr:Phytochelatin synthase, C-terminal [Cynara cardunculus var. scolymus]
MAMAGLYRRVLPSPPAIDFSSSEGKQLFIEAIQGGTMEGFMLISRLHRSPALLYTLSCKHESWIKIAKYLVEDVPTLLSCKDVKDVKDVLSIVFNSLPSKFLEFIKWVAEVRQREDGGQSLSSEEKERLAVKEEILKQVQEIRLYKHVTDFLFTGNSGSCKESCLTNIADSICCQGAGFLEGNNGSAKGFCCRETCVNCIKANGDTSVTVVSGMVTNGTGIQQVDVLVPSSSSKTSGASNSYGLSGCIGMHPASNDVLTVLLLALPPQTWFGIKDEKLLQEMSSLVSIDNLPTLLQEEIMHLRGQLYILKRCKDDEAEEDFGAPLF